MSDAERAIARISSSLRCAKIRDALSAPTAKSNAAAFSVPLNFLGAMERGNIRFGHVATTGTNEL